jgi:hypothetical protein
LGDDLSSDTVGIRIVVRLIADQDSAFEGAGKRGILPEIARRSVQQHCPALILRAPEIEGAIDREVSKNVVIRTCSQALNLLELEM